MSRLSIHKLVEDQRTYFYKGKTLPVSNRIDALNKIKTYIKNNEDKINDAIQKDLGKSDFETYMCETGLVLSEITYITKNIRKFSVKHKVKTPISQFKSNSYTIPSPYGVVLIMSPWNYPFLLSVEPLIDAIAAGNTAIIKPSEYSPETGKLIEEMISELFTPDYIAVITGGRKENSDLLDEKFDYIFFTGSKAVGKLVMSKASETLTPVTLELGGKSPCIVEKSANLKLAARRIVFGKFLNCGQTCVAPDFIYCDEAIKDKLIEEIKKEIVRQFGKTPLDNDNYGKIVNDKHFKRILSLISWENIVHGGGYNSADLRIEPTVLDNITFYDAIMSEEIFGPVLPILTYTSLKQAVNSLNRKPHPLALYIFTKNKSAANYVMTRCSFGGGCVNDTVIHLATSEMGFGGLGDSGMGSYHGKKGFDTFTHYKSIVDKKTWLDLPMRYQPYKKLFKKMIKIILD